MKSHAFYLILPIAAIVLMFGSCSESTITIDCNGSAASPSVSDDNSAADTVADNLVKFHATLESLNMTRSMSPLAANTRVTIFAYHGQTDNATSTAPMARGSYVAQQAGMLSGVSNYNMYLSNGLFDFYAVSANSTDRPPVFTNGVSSALQNGVDYLWWGCANYEINSPQVSVPIVFNHSATQVVFEIAAGLTSRRSAGIFAHTFPMLTVLVVFSAFFRIIEHIISFVQCLELSLSFRIIRMQIWMKLFCSFLICSLDVLLWCILWDTHNFVVINKCHILISFLFFIQQIKCQPVCGRNLYYYFCRY